MLVWVLGANPSKDTFWTTDNRGVNSAKLGGCPAAPKKSKKSEHTRHILKADPPTPDGCPADHSNASAPLHTMLALLSTGPVGFSDAVGQTNASLIKATCAADGTLLKPSKPITTIDRALALPSKGAGNVRPVGDNARVFAAYSGSTGSTFDYPSGGFDVLAWYFVSFALEKPWAVTADDFWPRIDSAAYASSASPASTPTTQMGSSATFAYRAWTIDGINGPGVAGGCKNLSQAADCAVRFFETAAQSPWMLLPAIADPKEQVAPTLTTVVPLCGGARSDAAAHGGFALLGETAKFAALSTNRFADVKCSTAGAPSTPLLTFSVIGYPVATNTSSYAQPNTEVVPIAVLTPEDKILLLDVAVPSGGRAHVACGGGSAVTCSSTAA
jgi:hypothetical protein